MTATRDTATMGTATPPAPPGRKPRPGPAGEPRILNLAERYGLLVLVAALIVIFGIENSDTFLTAGNFQSIGANQAVTVVLSLALLLPLTAGTFDLSVGSISVLSSIVAAKLMADHGWNLVESIVGVLVLGLVIGGVNGLLVTRFGLDGLIATLGTATILGALIQWYSGGQSVAYGFSDDLISFGTKLQWGVPWLVIVALLAAILFGYVLTQTPFGRMLASIGSSREAARLVGVRVDAVVVTSFLISGGTAGLSGVLLLAQQGSASPGVDGIGTLLPALAAVFLGASSWRPGEFNVVGTILGLLLLGVLISGLTLVGASPWVSPFCYGCALILAVGTSAWFRRKRQGTP